MIRFAALALVALVACERRVRARHTGPEAAEPAADRTGRRARRPSQAVALAPDRAALLHARTGCVRARCRAEAASVPRTRSPTRRSRSAGCSTTTRASRRPRSSTCNELPRCSSRVRRGWTSRPRAGHKGQRGARNSPTVYNAALHVRAVLGRARRRRRGAGEGSGAEPGRDGDALGGLRARRCSTRSRAMRRSSPRRSRTTRSRSTDRQLREGDRRVRAPPDHSVAVRRVPRGRRAPRSTTRRCAVCEAVPRHRLHHLPPGRRGRRRLCTRSSASCARSRPRTRAAPPITGNPADKCFFKVPSLRNAAKTGPCFHDGSMPRSMTRSATMAAVQLGRDLAAEQVATIRAFLESLTGTVDAAYIARPELPESGPRTPKPDPS